jgi:cytochrome c
MQLRTNIFLASTVVLAFSSLQAASADADGAKLFKNHCGTCHTLDSTAPKRQGPHLAGLLQRKSGSLPEFKYSPGLKAAGWQWTPEQLDLWLTDPKALLPDTLMSVYKQKDPAKRKLIIDYLKTDPKP